MSVRIRMKMMGRKHQRFFRICAIDKRSPRHGRVLEELGTYDPLVKETDARALLKGDRIDYWLGVGAQPSEKVAVLIKKYGTNGTHIDAQKVALDQLAQPKTAPDPGAPASLPESKEEKKEEAAAAGEPASAGGDGEATKDEAPAAKDEAAASGDGEAAKDETAASGDGEPVAAAAAVEATKESKPSE